LTFAPLSGPLDDSPLRNIFAEQFLTEPGTFLDSALDIRLHPSRKPLSEGTPADIANAPCLVLGIGDSDSTSTTDIPTAFHDYIASKVYDTRTHGVAAYRKCEAKTHPLAVAAQ
jgi:hypothetical protein